jgi:hypothetical protein
MKIKCVGCKFEKICRDYCEAIGWTWEFYLTKAREGYCHIIAELKYKKKNKGNKIEKKEKRDLSSFL